MQKIVTAKKRHQSALKGFSMTGFLCGILAICLIRLHRTPEDPNVDSLVRKTYQLSRVSIAMVLLVGFT